MPLFFNNKPVVVSVSKFLKAVKDNNTAIVEQYLSQASPQDLYENIIPAVMIAAQDDNYRLTIKLLNAVGHLKEAKEAAIFAAISAGKTFTAENLVSIAGTNPNIRDEKGTPLLIVAIKANLASLVNLLLTISTIDVNATDKDGNTALHFAAMNKFPDVVLRILGNPDAKLDIVNKSGELPQHVANKFTHTRHNSILITSARGSRILRPEIEALKAYRQEVMKPDSRLKQLPRDVTDIIENMCTQSIQTLAKSLSK